MAQLHRPSVFRPRLQRRLRPAEWLAALLLTLPLVLSACGETVAPTATTGAAAATVAPTRAATAAPAAMPTAAITGATTAPATTGTPAAMPTVAAPANTAARPTTTMAMQGAARNITLPEGTKRGEGGTLRLIWWQAPTIMNAHLAQGTKDFDASRVVAEPLATFSRNTLNLPDVPVLAKEIPSTQNGQLAADGTSVTWKLRENVTWSDGTPFTAEDVIFTHKFIANKANGAVTVAEYDLVKDVTAPDPLTVKVTFTSPTPVWYLPFVGSRGVILPKHVVAACDGNAKACPYNLKPVGTGPFVVTDFRPGDTVLYAANEKFREPNAPFFAKVEMKGGGDATTAMKAVQTGQADFAWNPQVTPDLYKQFTDSGATLAVEPGTSAEQMIFNFADPSIEVEGEKSSPRSKNPFWSDKNVRQAVAMAIDRDAMAKNLYGAAGVATNTIIPTVWNGPEWKYDQKMAGTLLDMAGWKPGADGVRVKDGKRFAITIRTASSSVRDKETLLIQQNLKAIGIAVEIRNVDSSIFFGQPDNPDQRARFETDLQIFSEGSGSPDMYGWLARFQTSAVSSKENGWKGTNFMRWSNAEYDATAKELNTTLDGAKRLELFKKLDQIAMNDYAIVPLVARTSLAAYVKGLEGVNNGSWDSNVWNIAHWTIKR